MDLIDGELLTGFGAKGKAVNVDSSQGAMGRSHDGGDAMDTETQRRSGRIASGQRSRALGSAIYWALQSRFGRYARLSRRVVRRHGLVVSSGPFAGLRYTRRTAVGRIVAKLVGSYEEELHGVIDQLLEPAPRVVVNIGSAEGYYAVGLALRLPRARIHAFESDPHRRRLCRELARENRVAERVVVHGTCDLVALDELQPLGELEKLVVCDCEGEEDRLLLPEMVPWLREARLLVELHDALVPGTSQRLSERFAPSHELRFIDEQPRDQARYPALSFLSAYDREQALDEYRRDHAGRALGMRWALLSPRSH